jgi:hypothetical protein
LKNIYAIYKLGNKRSSLGLHFKIKISSESTDYQQTFQQTMKVAPKPASSSVYQISKRKGFLNVKNFAVVV